MQISPTLAHTRAELAAALETAPAPRAVVMTMGALHEGHLDLLRAAAEKAGNGGTVVVTIFVNPLQFAPGEDLEAYPRDLQGDVAKLSAAASAAGLQNLVVFAPTPEVMYPLGEPSITINPGALATVLEGATRPTHFGGVCQVVLKLLQLTQPDWAMFGRKDAQQLAIVKAMVRDLDVPVEIVPVEIRREADGLAMSSRNAYLSDVERQQALELSQSLQTGYDLAEHGAAPAEILSTVRAQLEAADGVELDYVALVDPDSFVDLADAGLGLPAAALSASAEQMLLAVAARVGRTRLIDNRLLPRN